MIRRWKEQLENKVYGPVALKNSWQTSSQGAGVWGRSYPLCRLSLSLPLIALLEYFFAQGQWKKG